MWKSGKCRIRSAVRALEQPLPGTLHLARSLPPHGHRMHGIEPEPMHGVPGKGEAMNKKSDCAGGSCVAPVLAGSLGGPTLGA